LFLESSPHKVADLGSDLGLVGLQNTQPSWSPIPIPWRTERLCGITIKGKWQWDALRPGFRLLCLDSAPGGGTTERYILILSLNDCDRSTSVLSGYQPFPAKVYPLVVRSIQYVNIVKRHTHHEPLYFDCADYRPPTDPTPQTPQTQIGSRAAALWSES